MNCKGHVASVARRAFYGTPETQFMRTLVRLGLCLPTMIPPEMPAWARALLGRRMQTLGSRAETYRVAKAMLESELEGTGPIEVWTCMLLQGESDPETEYLSVLYRLLEEDRPVIIHRVVNLTAQSLANTAQSLFRRHHDAIDKGTLRVYGSHVDNLELLICPQAVLLAFPVHPKGSRTSTKEIGFGVYCEDAELVKKMAQWYRECIVDSGYGRLHTQVELNAAIEEAREAARHRPNDG